MNKKWTTVTIIVLLLILAGYVVVDVALRGKSESSPPMAAQPASNPDKWIISKTFEPGKGQLNAVTVSTDGLIYLGGETFTACYDTAFNLKWEYRTEMPVSALAVYGDNLFAAVESSILILDVNGKKTGEWGPFESNAMITSVSANNNYVAYADAANKCVMVFDKTGVVKYIIGKSDNSFIIPSFYFEVALDKGNNLFVANTGNRRIEKRNIDGTLISYFGEPGLDPGAFCGCCNPSHFALIPGGFITAEKGINRIKILDEKGAFVEFVSSVNNFIPPLPLDIATTDGKIIYGANPADSKLYVFRRKNE